MAEQTWSVRSLEGSGRLQGNDRLEASTAKVARVEADLPEAKPQGRVPAAAPTDAAVGVAADPHDGAAGGAAGGRAGAPRPVWPTRIPQNFEQPLQVRRGALAGQGLWTWAVDRGRYRSQLSAGLEGGAAGAKLQWSSQGGLDDHGVAPERFLTRPTRGGARAVNFQRDTGRVSYSGPTGHADLVAGAQDRLSWLVQLLALVQAGIDANSRAGAAMGLPARLPIWVAGPQGDGGDWWFDLAPGPAPGCWHFSRRPDRRYDVQVNLWVVADPHGPNGSDETGPRPSPDVRLARLVLGHEGSRQPPWELWDPERAARCGLGP